MSRVATTADALALCAAHGAVTIVANGAGVPSLVEAITGGPIRGSWWAHPEGKRIFRITTELEQSGRVVGVKLVPGVRGEPIATFVDRALWPALVRVVTDRAWRAPRIAALAPDPARLLARVEQAGELHGDDVELAAKPFAAARRALEDALLVHARSEHTERGHHAAVLSSWTRWCPPDVAAAARAMALDQAEAALARFTSAGTPRRRRR